MSTIKLDKARIKQAFAAASASYDGVAELQRTVGRELLQHANIDNLSGTILDLGCGTGFLTAELLDRHPNLDKIIALDLASTMLHTTRDKLTHSHGGADRQRMIYLCADAERLPITDHALNGIFSNLALQWCNPIENVLAGIKRTLKPGSPLAFSTFGPQTLRELKDSWAKVDDYSHVNEFHSAEEVHIGLEQAGFTAPRIIRKLHQPRYESVTALMQELKQIGAHNASTGRNRCITTKSQMRKMIAAYEHFRNDGLIPATFEAILVIARA